MANAFSICALVQDWRAYLPPGVAKADGTDIKDPHWYETPRLFVCYLFW